MKKHESTRHPLQNCMVRSRKFHKQKRHLFIHALHTVLPNSMHSGSLSITEKPIICLHATASCLIMKALYEEKLLSPGKSQERLQRLHSTCRKNSSSETWTPKETGATQKTMS